MQVHEDKVREKAYQLCKEYLQGKWKEIVSSQLVIKQISGGLSNVVFYVGLPEHLIDTEAREPTQVLLRLFGDLSSGPVHEFRLVQETLVFTMLAERNLGPRLFGVFPGGRLEEFIQGHPLTSEELRSPVYSEEIAKNTGLIHSLNVPVSKDPNWLGDTMRSLALKLAPMVPDRVPQSEREAVTFLKKVNLRQEVDWLLSFLRNVPSPVVFSHNDINCGNILVRDDPESWDPVVLIDFEFAAYNYRGFDLANHFIEWIYDYGTKTFPYFSKNESKYPTRAQMERWVKRYLEVYEEQKSLQDENNLHHKRNQVRTKGIVGKEKMEDILDEIAAYSLASHLLWVVWACKQAQTSSITFSYYCYSYTRLKDYFKEKEEVIELFKKKKGMKRKEGES